MNNFYEEQPLIGQHQCKINGILAVEINSHPALGIGELAKILRDTAEDLEKELASRNPVQYDTRVTTLTVPAVHIGSHVNNLLDDLAIKFNLALQAGDTAAADRFFDRSQKLYEWVHNNYTPDAIKNGPIAEHQHNRLEPFRVIRSADKSTKEDTP